MRGDADKGRRFYLSNCYVCHGEHGDGQGPRASFIRPPPRNFLAPEARLALNRPELFAATAISGGKRGTVMPAWSSVLGGQEVADVTEFVFTAFIAPPPEPQKKKVVN